MESIHKKKLDKIKSRWEGVRRMKYCDLFLKAVFERAYEEGYLYCGHSKDTNKDYDDRHPGQHNLNVTNRATIERISKSPKDMLTLIVLVDHLACNLEKEREKVDELQELQQDFSDFSDDSENEQF